MLSLYLFLQPALLRLLHLLARHSDKFAELVRARDGLMPRWREAARANQLGPEGRVWVHVSSVGELEQARPVIEYLGTHGRAVVLSYFSTSVPKLVKDWSFVAHADFLPFDTPEEMRELFGLIAPSALVLNRYDLWPNHVLAAAERGVPVVLINASTPPVGLFGRFSMFVRRSLFRSVSGWTFVDAAAAAAWEPCLDDSARGLVTGDPRVDRALARAERQGSEGKARERLALWKRREFCLVAGSTWTPDEQVLLDAWREVEGNKCLVIVPHEPDPEHLERLEAELRARKVSHVRFSRLTKDNGGAEILIVDQRGFLAEIYGLADLTFVGGGFTRHIHSIIEPSAHGKLVAFGPRFFRSPEAFTLWAAGSACALRGPGKAGQLAAWIRQMRRPGDARARASESLRVFLQMHRGAGVRVGEFVLGRLRK